MRTLQALQSHRGGRTRADSHLTGRGEEDDDEEEEEVAEEEEEEEEGEGDAEP